MRSLKKQSMLLSSSFKFPTKHPCVAGLLLGKASIVWCPPAFWELDPSAAPPQASALHRDSRGEPAPCDPHACSPHPSTAAPAQGDTTAHEASPGAKPQNPGWENWIAGGTRLGQIPLVYLSLRAEKQGVLMIRNSFGCLPLGCG